MVNSKHAFWQALVFTILIFVLGIFLGFFLENSRADNLERTLFKSELNILDEQLRDRVTVDLEIDCELARESLFNFADSIYAEAITLEDYDSASKFGDDLRLVHKRYDLLRTMLWLESLDIRNRCGNDFHTVVYFYEYATDDLDTRAEQIYFSRILEDLKNKHQNEILLIPIAGNLELASVSLALESYGIDDLPIVLIDENIRIDKVITFEEFEEKVLE